MKKTVFCLLLMLAFVITLSSCGAVEFNVNFIVDGELYATVGTSGGEAIKIPDNPTKDGFTFDGWYWDNGTFQKPFSANSLLDAPLSSDMSVYAKWTDGSEEIPKFKVTFETNGGSSLAPISSNVISESPITTKDYNTFIGWYTDPSLQESTRVSFPLTVTSDITLYAKWSVDFTEGLQLTLQASTNTYFVTGYTGTESTVNIPSTYKGLDVTGINARAFEGNSMITKAVIPNSVITVGLGAFSECYNLVTVDMSDQLQLLGASAFSNCIKLESIDLPDTLENIGGEAFFGCTALSELYLSNELLNIGTNIIRGCTSLKKLTLPGRITLISLVGDTNDNIPQSLTDIIFANGSESICENALYNCSQVERIIIPDTVKTIYSSAFYGCSDLTNVTVPGSVEIIGSNVFGNCTNLESLTVPFIGASLNGTVNTHFGYIFGAPNYQQNGSFIPQSLTSVTVTVAPSIDDNAFYGCNSITEIIFPASLSSLGSSAFDGCESLCGVYASNLASWCEIDFENEKSNPLFYARKLYINRTPVENLTIPSTVTEIKPYAFYNCNLTSVNIPQNVQICGFSAFGSCSTMESITLPFIGKSRDEIENTHFGYIFGASDYAYNYSCVPAALRSVVITDSTVIDGYAFYKCTGLTAVNIPDSIQEINECAFYLCSGIESLSIPAGVTNIEPGAFGACSNLKEITISDQNESYVDIDSVVYTKNGASLIQYPAGKTDTYFNIPETVQAVCDYAFAVCSNLDLITISSNTVTIGDYAFLACSKITELYIPSNVLRIGYGALIGCNGLENLTLPFVGETANGENNTHFGYIFGAQSYTVNNGNVPAMLKSIVILGGESIASSAFYGCESLENITVSDGITSIGSGAFFGCISLKSIRLPFVGNLFSGSQNTHFGYIFGAANYNENSSYVPTGLKTVVITGGTNIASYAFNNCASLYDVTIPNSVRQIGTGAFKGCSGIVKITLPFIGHSSDSTGAFSHFGSIFDYTRSTSWISHHLYLEEEYGNYYYRFNIPASLQTVVITGGESVNEYAFKNCTTIRNIVLPDSLKSFDVGAIEGCSNIVYNENNNGKYLGTYANPYLILIGMVDSSATSFTISDATKIICDYAFRASSLHSITVPDNVTSIGRGAFNGCTQLFALTLPFIGESRDAVNYKSHFGYIFGYSMSMSEPSHYHYFDVEYIDGGSQRRYYYYTYDFLRSLNVTISDGVTSIGSQAFRGCAQLLNIVIPNSVTSIGSSAFRGCSNINSITIPNNVTSIGSYAFEACSKLNRINIPSNITNIETSAFQNCTSLESISIPANVASIGDYAFQNCTSLSSISIPANAESIGNHAFYNCTSLESISIPANVASIGEYAFFSCKGLTSVSIGNGVTSIGVSAFSNCTSLTSVTIPTSVTSIGSNAFIDCTNLTIYCEIAEKPSSWNLAWNYSNCTVVWDCNNNDVAEDGYIYTVIDGIRYGIKNGYATVVKQNTNSFTEINIPTSIIYRETSYPVKEIEQKAFYQCTSLTSISIPNSVTSIGGAAFAYCTSLASVTIPNSITSIGSYAFYNCTSLASIRIPNSVTSIGIKAFQKCSALASIEMPLVNEKFVDIFDSSRYADVVGETAPCLFDVTIIGGGDIGNASFLDCNRLKSVTISNGVTSIGNSAFNGCQYLTTITIGSSVERIGTFAFDGCTSLSTVRFEENSQLNAIDEDAFCDCTSLQTVVIPNSVTIIGNSVFSGCNKLTSITLSNSTLSIGNYLFSGCSKLQTITIPYSVTSIGIGAFKNCTSLSSITFENANGWWTASSKDATSGTSISSSSLSIPSSAANYLKTTYLTQYWKRG